MKSMVVALLTVIIFISPTYVMAEGSAPPPEPSHSVLEQNTERFQIVAGPGNVLLLFDMKEGYVWAGYFNGVSGKFYFEHVTFDYEYMSAVESKRALHRAANKEETADFLKSIQVK